MKRFILHSVVTLLLLLSSLVAPCQKPIITGFSPLSGPITTTVTITGSGFNVAPANNIVYFGAVKAIVSGGTSTLLTVTVPAGASYQYISVLNTANKLIGYSLFPFTTTFSGCAPLNVNSLAPRLDFAAGSVTRSVVLSDLDGDGKADMIATNTGTYNISVFRNTSTAGVTSFAGKVDIASGSAPSGAGASGIATGDIDGDGKLDIVVSNYNSMDISVFINTTLGTVITFAPKVDFPTWDVLPPLGFINPLGVAINDLDADGKADIAVANFSTASVALFKNTSVAGTPSFVRQMLTTGLTAPRELAIGDLDGDGKPDLVVSDETASKVLAYLNTSPGSGAFTFSAPFVSVTGNSPRGVSLGDLDGDGKLDMAIVNSGGAGSVSVFRNTSFAGTLSFTTKVDYVSGASPREVTLADIDGDGKPEMAASSNTVTNAKLTCFRNTSIPGSISFATMVSFPAGNNALGVALQDVNNDGKVDAVVASSSTGTVGVFVNITPEATLSALASATVTSSGVCDNGTWKTVYDAGSNDVLVAIRYNGNDLGTVTASVYVESQPGTVGNGQHYMARHFVIESSIQPITPVQVRLYFKNTELLDLKALDQSIVTIDDLSVTRYEGLFEDGLFDIIGGILDLISPTSITTGYDYGGDYLEFSTLTLSEYWIHSGLFVLQTNLTSFTAHKKEKEVLLKWTAANDENADRFIIEKSVDGLNYDNIGTVMAAVSTGGKNAYTYSDKNPVDGKNFYRLQLVNKQGSKQGSKVLLLNMTSGDETTVQITYQSMRQVRATISGKVNNGTLLIHDGSGRQVKSFKINTSDAGTILNIDLSNFGSGLYLYQLITERGSISKGKIVVR